MVPGIGEGGGGSSGGAQKGNIVQQAVGKFSDTSGLNPNRQKGFGDRFPRIETPRLADMRAKQGAVVARF